jgi:hypothetical protein
MSWLILAFAMPVLVAWKDGSTYAFAFSVSGIGLAIYLANIALIRLFILRRAPSTLTDDTWERTAGKGIVPRWVSVLGLVGMGFVPSGLIVALLLFFGFFANLA